MTGIIRRQEIGSTKSVESPNSTALFITAWVEAAGLREMPDERLRILERKLKIDALVGTAGGDIDLHQHEAVQAELTRRGTRPQ